MAEILIQRKHRRRVWPWLLGLLVLAVLPLPFMNARRERSMPPVQTAARDSITRRDSTPLRDSAGTTLAQAAAAVAAPARERTTATAAGSIALPDTTRPAIPTRSETPVKATSSGNAFDRVVAASNPKWDDRSHRRYTADALRSLADELRSLGAREVGVRTIRVHADSLVLASARQGARPDYARAAFLAAVHELDLLQGRYKVAVDTGRLRATAWAIKPDRGLVAQRGTVQRFFETARDALHSLARKG